MLLEKYQKIYAILILYIIAYIYSINIVPAVAEAGKTNDSMKKWNSYHETCIIGGSPECLTKYRGNNYYIANMDSEKQSMLSKCFMTFWGFSHMLLYTIIGYLAPDMFMETFSIGLLFELYEMKKYGCEDALDILFNSTGFMIGSYLSKLKF